MIRRMGTHSLSLEEMADQAEVDLGYIRRLIDLGALEERRGAKPYGSSDVGRIRLLRAWEAAGLSVEAVLSVVRAGELSISWLDAPAIGLGQRLDLTYEQLCAEEDIPVTLIQGLHEALGFAPPDPADRAREGDRPVRTGPGPVPRRRPHRRHRCG
jgi:hypothetical protein